MKQQEQEFGIHYKCPGCKKLIIFPTAENEVPTRWELLAHAIYTAFINDGRKCVDCESKIKGGKN